MAEKDPRPSHISAVSPDAPTRRPSEEKSGTTTAISSLVGSALTAEQKIAALVGLLGIDSQPGANGNGNTGGGNGQPPNQNPSKGGSIVNWVFGGLIGLSLLGDAHSLIDKGDPVEPKDPIENPSKDLSESIDNLAGEVKGLKESLEEDRKEQELYNTLIIEAVGELGTLMSPDNVPDSVGYLQRMHMLHSGKKETHD